MRIAIYSRVSTRGQRVTPQLDALRDYCDRRGAEAVEFTDRAVSGARDRRPALDKMVDAVRRREVDAVATVKLDRLARSLRHLLELGETFEAMGVDLIVLDQGIDTSTPTGRLTFQLLGAMAEFERSLARERIMAGLASAKRRGQRLGRKPALEPRDVARVKRLSASGHSVRAIAAKVGVGSSTVQRALRG